MINEINYKLYKLNSVYIGHSWIESSTASVKLKFGIFRWLSICLLYETYNN